MKAASQIFMQAPPLYQHIHPFSRINDSLTVTFSFSLRLTRKGGLRMKNIKLVCMACLLVLLAACGSKPMPEEDNQSGAPQVKNEIQAEEASVKAEAELENGKEEAKLTLKNSSDREIGTGTAYVLEKWTDGEWKKVNTDQMFTEQMIMVKAGENYDQAVDLKDQDAGTYRVAKEFFKDEEKHKVAVVFEKK
jgi:hypothetical protein